MNLWLLDSLTSCVTTIVLIIILLKFPFNHLLSKQTKASPSCLFFTKLEVSQCMQPRMRCWKACNQAWSLNKHTTKYEVSINIQPSMKCRKHATRYKVSKACNQVWGVESMWPIMRYPNMQPSTRSLKACNQARGVQACNQVGGVQACNQARGVQAWGV